MFDGILHLDSHRFGFWFLGWLNTVPKIIAYMLNLTHQTQ